MKIQDMQSMRGEIRMAKLFRSAILLASCLGQLVLSSSSTWAQTTERMELGASYSFVNANAPPGDCGCFSMNGGSGWFSYNFGHGLGLVGEVGSQYASNINRTTTDLTLTSFLVGPRHTWHPGHRIAPFGQVLVGGAHASGALTPTSSGLPVSENAFAMAAGGGVDVALGRHVALRLLQADYYLTRFDNGVNDHQNNLRIGEGIVFRFGRER
jgi:peptidoglycan-associated lipoprotein